MGSSTPFVRGASERTGLGTSSSNPFLDDRRSLASPFVQFMEGHDVFFPLLYSYFDETCLLPLLFFKVRPSSLCLSSTLVTWSISIQFEDLFILIFFWLLFVAFYCLLLDSCLRMCSNTATS